MARVLATTIAEAVEGRTDQRFHVFGGGMRSIEVPGVPFPYGRLGLVICLEVGQDERKIAFSATIEDPAGTVMISADNQLVRQGELPAQDVWLAFNFIPVILPSAGVYRIVVRSGESEHTLPLAVTVIPQQMVASIPGSGNIQ